MVFNGSFNFVPYLPAIERGKENGQKVNWIYYKLTNETVATIANALISPTSQCSTMKLSSYSIRNVSRTGCRAFGNVLRTSGVDLILSQKESHIKDLFDTFDIDNSGAFDFEQFSRVMLVMRSLRAYATNRQLLYARMGKTKRSEFVNDQELMNQIGNYNVNDIEPINSNVEPHGFIERSDSDNELDEIVKPPNSENEENDGNEENEENIGNEQNGDGVMDPVTNGLLSPLSSPISSPDSPANSSAIPNTKQLSIRSNSTASANSNHSSDSNDDSAEMNRIDSNKPPLAQTLTNKYDSDSDEKRDRMSPELKLKDAEDEQFADLMLQRMAEKIRIDQTWTDNSNNVSIHELIESYKILADSYHRKVWLLDLLLKVRTSTERMPCLDYDTPLYYAVKANNLQMVTLLIAYGYHRKHRQEFEHCVIECVVSEQYKMALVLCEQQGIPLVVHIRRGYHIESAFRSTHSPMGSDVAISTGVFTGNHRSALSATSATSTGFGRIRSGNALSMGSATSILEEDGLLDMDESFNPFVSVTVFGQTAKTDVIYNSNGSPHWNHYLLFIVPFDKVDEYIETKKLADLEGSMRTEENKLVGFNLGVDSPTDFGSPLNSDRSHASKSDSLSLDIAKLNESPDSPMLIGNSLSNSLKGMCFGEILGVAMIREVTSCTQCFW